MGSNCVPCIEYHMREARKVGLVDGQIEEAVHLADKVRQVPARKVLAAAVGMLQQAGTGTEPGRSASDRTQPVGAGGAESSCCG